MSAMTQGKSCPIGVDQLVIQPMTPINASAVQVQSVGMGIIEEYLAHLKRRGCTGDTLTLRSYLLRRLERELPFGVAEVAVEDLRAWLHNDEYDWSQSARATFYTGIRSFYKWASDPRDPWITQDPTENLEPTRHPQGVARPVSNDDLALILTKAAEPYRTWAKLAAYNGLRCCEIAGLDREDITEAELLVTRGKGGDPRQLVTDEIVWAAVKDLPVGPIARGRNGKRCLPRQVSENASRHFHIQVGVGVTMHMLRHWLGVNVQACYRDIRTTMEALGHKQLSSTQIYTRSTVEQQRAAQAAIPRLAG